MAPSQEKASPMKRRSGAAIFKLRKPTLKKKAYQLQTLCGISVCLVCFGPDGTVDMWPETETDVKKAIMSYKGLELRKKHESNLLDILRDKKRKLEEKKFKAMKKEVDELTVALSNLIDELSDDPLMDLVKNFESKLIGFKEKIQLLTAEGKGKEILVDNGQVSQAMVLGFADQSLLHDKTITEELNTTHCTIMGGNSTFTSRALETSSLDVNNYNWSWDNTTGNTSGNNFLCGISGETDTGLVGPENFELLDGIYNQFPELNDNSSFGFQPVDTSYNAQENFGIMEENNNYNHILPGNYPISLLHEALPASGWMPQPL